jgi:hypothetical protein
MIAEETAVRAKEAVHRAMQGKWPRARTEIQDGGEFLLMSIYTDSKSPIADDTAKYAVITAMEELLPKGCWMLIVDRSGRTSAILPAS